MFTVLGVASNWTSKPPAGEGIATFCHTPALVTQFAAVMVSAAVPLWPSLVAGIVAPPAARPVTSPLALTLATGVLLFDQGMVRPASAVPVASFGGAVNCAGPPSRVPSGAGGTAT